MKKLTTTLVAMVAMVAMAASVVSAGASETFPPGRNTPCVGNDCVVYRLCIIPKANRGDTILPVNYTVSGKGTITVSAVDEKTMTLHRIQRVESEQRRFYVRQTITGSFQWRDVNNGPAVLAWLAFHGTREIRSASLSCGPTHGAPQPGAMGGTLW